MLNIQFLAEFGGACTFGYLTLREILKHLSVRVQQRTKAQAVSAKEAANPLLKYNSFLEVATQAADLLDQQAQAIAKECEKQGKDPMQDTGYMTVVKQHQEALKWQTRLQSPFGQIADSMTFPVVKGMAADTVKSLSRMIKP